MGWKNHRVHQSRMGKLHHSEISTDDAIIIILFVVNVLTIKRQTVQ